MTPSPQAEIPWWLDHFLIPAFFTFFGASMGFGFARLKESLDDRKAKKAFLKAIRIEMSTVRDYLKGTLRDATEYKESLETGHRKVLYLVSTFPTAVYASQIGRLKDVSDPLIIEVLEFYSNLSNLERIKSHLTSASFDLTKLTEQEAHREGPLAGLYGSSLSEVIRRTTELLAAAERVIAKLPS